jgi:hypothetical protein
LQLNQLLSIEGRPLPGNGKQAVFFVVQEKLEAGKYLIKVGSRLLTAKTHLDLPIGKKLQALPSPKGWVVQLPQNHSLQQGQLSPILMALGQEGLPVNESLLRGLPTALKQKLQKNRRLAKLFAVLLKQTDSKARPYIEALLGFLEDYEESSYSEGEDSSGRKDGYLLALQAKGKDRWQFWPLKWKQGNQEGRLILKYREKKKEVEFAAKVLFPHKEYGIHLRGKGSSWLISLFTPQEEKALAQENLQYYQNSLVKTGLEVKIQLEVLDDFDGFGKWQNWSRKAVDEKV